MTIAEAARSGDRLAELVAMRMRLAEILDDPACPAREIASLSRRQLEIGREIDAMNAAAQAEREEARGSGDAEVWDASAI